MKTQTLQPIQFDRVADLYDSYVGVEFDIPFWLHETGCIAGKVLELACGTGRVSIPLLNAGVDLSCVDYAPTMLEHFRRKLGRHQLYCPLYCQDMAELTVPGRFDLIFIPFHSFSEILDKARQRETLMRIHSHLTQQGTFICTLQNPSVRTASMDGASHMLGEFPMQNGDLLQVRSRLRYDRTTQLASGEQVYERLTHNKRLIDRRCLDIDFYLFHKEEFESLIAGCGFDVAALYGDYDRNPFEPATSPFMIWKLKKNSRTANVYQ